MAEFLKCLIPTIGSPKTLNGREGRYELAAFYCELLGMEVVYEDWLLIAGSPPRKFFIAFDADGWSEQRPPRWPDPEHPQQAHLDLLVGDLEAASAAVTKIGATLLRDDELYRVYADPVGHPFCLYPDPDQGDTRVGRLVLDCPSPRALASFYEGFLGTGHRVEDSADRVVVDLGDETLPDLAFQRAQFRAARWPDPDYPAQLHVDFRWHDSLTARAALQRAKGLGAMRLRPQSGVYADPASHPFCIQNEIPDSFDLVGLYLNPPEYAVVYGVETAGPAELPPARDRGVQRDTRTELADLLGTLDTPDDIEAESGDRAAEFRRFLTKINSAPDRLELNLVCDWDGTYQEPAIRDWLAEHSDIVVHRNPPEAEWAEQGAGWLAYCIEELTDRDDHTAAMALDGALRSWARSWSNDHHPFLWHANIGEDPAGTDRRRIPQ